MHLKICPLILLLISAILFGGCVKRNNNPYARFRAAMEKNIEPEGFRKNVRFDHFDKVTRYSYGIGTALLPNLTVTLEKGENVTFTTTLCVYSSRLIFAEEAYLKIDDSEPVSVELLDATRQPFLSTTSVEICTLNLTPSVLKQISEARIAVFRISGSGGKADYETKPADRAAIKWLLEEYDGNESQAEL